MQLHVYFELDGNTQTVRNQADQCLLQFPVHKDAYYRYKTEDQFLRQHSKFSKKIKTKTKEDAIFQIANLQGSNMREAIKRSDSSMVGTPQVLAFQMMWPQQPSAAHKEEAYKAFCLLPASFFMKEIVDQCTTGHQYFISSLIMYTGGHYFAILRTRSGWIVANEGVQHTYRHSDTVVDHL